MSVATQPGWIRHTGDGASTTFPYDFLLLAASELEVYLDGMVTTAYNLTGLGNPAGGLVVFYLAPALSVAIVFRRVTATSQNVTLAPAGLLPARTVEAVFDRLTLLTQDLHEICTRIPTLVPWVKDALRNLEFPRPGIVPLLGWNAQGTALTLYPPTVIYQVLDPPIGHTFVRTEVLFTAAHWGGRDEMRAAGALPANSLILGVPVSVEQGFGNGNGLTGLLVGDDEVGDRWTATPLGLEMGLTTDEGWFSGDAQVRCKTARDLVIRGVDGAFDGFGVLKAVIHSRQLSVLTGITITPAAGQRYFSASYTLAAADFVGQPEMRAVAALPPNTLILGVPVLVESNFGSSGGATALLVGDGLVVDRWSREPLSLMSGTTTGDGDFSAQSEVRQNSAGDVVIRAVGGVFDPDGVITVVIHYRTLSTS
jgi:hypothetical protein